MSVVSSLIVKTLPLVPRRLVGYFARPYIAGETLDDGVRVARELNARGVMATMDVLGESVASTAECDAMGKRCADVLRAIRAHGLDSSLSVKPTQLGLSIDPALCEGHLRALCVRAAEDGNAVTIDMEDRATTDATLAIYGRLRSAFPGVVGAVLQAYMRRSADDARALLASGAPPTVRLCKGIYVEPERVAFRDREEIRANYRAILRLLVEGGAYVQIATHDDALLDDALELVGSTGLPKDRYEFQMLLGVRPKRRDEIVASGHRMRVYVPFGEQWYAYSTRRLKENPRMALHIVKALLGFRG